VNGRPVRLALAPVLLAAVVALVDAGVDLSHAALGVIIGHIAVVAAAEAACSRTQFANSAPIAMSSASHAEGDPFDPSVKVIRRRRRARALGSQTVRVPGCESWPLRGGTTAWPLP